MESESLGFTGLKIPRDYIIELEGNFGNASLKISSYPSANNAKSSEIAAWSVLYILWKLRRSIVFY